MPIRARGSLSSGKQRNRTPSSGTPTHPGPSLAKQRGAMSTRKIVRQTVVLRLDTQGCVAHGYTELVIQPNSPFKEIQLHCRQIMVTAAAVDGHSAKFRLADPLAQVLPPGTSAEAKLSTEDFDGHYAKALERADAGELTVTLPLGEVVGWGQDQGFEKVMLRVDFVIARPTSGACFVEGTVDAPRPPQFFACPRGPGPWGARLWLPCDDSHGCSNPFELVVTTRASDVVACSGILEKHTATDDALEELDGALANARIGDTDWEAWHAIYTGVTEFVAQSRRLPCAPETPLGGTGPSSNPAVNREAWLAEWCNYQCVLKRAGELTEEATKLLSKLPGWEWEPLRTSYYRIKQSILPSRIAIAAGPFNVYADPVLPHVTHLGVPGRGRLDELIHTTEVRACASSSCPGSAFALLCRRTQGLLALQTRRRSDSDSDSDSLPLS